MTVYIAIEQRGKEQFIDAVYANIDDAKQYCNHLFDQEVPYAEVAIIGWEVDKGPETYWTYTNEGGWHGEMYSGAPLR